MAAPVTLEGFVNLDAVERAVAGGLRQSLEERRLILDLARAKWISPLSVSTLFCWMSAVADRSGEVTLHAPAESGLAAHLFAKAGIASALEAERIRAVSPPYSRNYDDWDRLVAFETFKDHASFEKHLATLSEAPQRRVLLNSPVLPEIVNSGHFHNVLLRELLDNAFVHGEGRHSHYCAIEVSASKRLDHSFISQFDNHAFIEIAVGDCSRNNLVDRLRPLVPSAYKPRVIPVNSKLDKIHNTILWAFEYASSSAPERRRRYVADWLASGVDDISTIATGLFDVARIAEGYQGQVIVRVAGRLITIDYSRRISSPSARDYPRVATWGKALAKLPGTIVCLRLPLVTYRSLSARRTDQVPTDLLPAKEISPSLHVVAPELTQSRDQTIQSLSELEEQVALFMSQHGSTPLVAVVVLDGLQFESKLLSALLQLLARIPRADAGLLVVSSDPRLPRVAADMWNEVVDRGFGAGNTVPALVVAADDGTAVATFGATGHPQATLADGAKLMLPGKALCCDIVRATSDSRRVALDKWLATPNVLHEGEHYLIPGRYYTTRLYEVRKLADFSGMLSIAAGWLATLLRQQDATVIVTLVEWIGSLADLATARAAIAPTSILRGADQSVTSLALRSWFQSRHKGSIVLLTDVICTASDIREFAQALPPSARLLVVTLVDARPESTPYLPVSRSHGTVDLQIISVRRDSIAPTQRKPIEVSARDILIMDRRTGVLTKYALPGESIIDDDVLVSNTIEHGALAAGHFVLGAKHLVYYFDLSALFRGFAHDISAWLASEWAELHAFTTGDTRDTVLYCLDEDTGLAGLAERFLRTAPDIRFQIVTRDSLIAPPARPDNPPALAWFLLPAAGSGLTARRCLEYGRAIGAKRIAVSVVTARLSEDEALFFNRVDGYGDRSVRLRWMLALPFPVYSGSTCPVCRLHSELMGVQRSLPEGSATLADALSEASVDLRDVPVNGAAAAVVELVPSGQAALGEEVRLVLMYRRSIRDLETRRTLEERLKSPNHVVVLATGIGRTGERGDDFAAERKEVIYGTPALEEACASFVQGAHDDAGVFGHTLRGLLILGAGGVQGFVKRLLESSERRPELLRRVVAEIVMHADWFRDDIERLFGLRSHTEGHRLLGEVREFVRSGGARRRTEGVIAVHDLSWHLMRTSGWTGPLSGVAAQLRRSRSTPAVVADSVNKFVVDGYHEAIRLVDRARNLSRTWGRLEQLCGIGEYWETLKASVLALVDSTSAPAADVVQWRRDVALALGRVDAATAALIDVVMGLGTKPSSAIRALRELRPDAAVITSIDPHCPPAAILPQDFEEILVVLLDNAIHSVGEDHRLDLRFEPAGANGEYVLLRAQTPGPWVDSNRLEGGLRRLRQIAADYSATLHKPGSGGSELRIYFYGWLTDSLEPMR